MGNFVLYVLTLCNAIDYTTLCNRLHETLSFLFGKGSFMANIYDIAKLANVSAATVSRALANNEKISAASRERIQKIAEELGYRPNLVARNLRQKSSLMIGLILDDVSDELSGFIARGVEDEARKNGFSVLLWNIQHELDSELAALDFFTNLKLDGVILADTTLNAVEEFPHLKMPTVLINRTGSEEESIHNVLTDDYAGGYDATEYLLKLNHKKIAFINGPFDWHASAKRLNGYYDALRDHHVEPRAEFVKHGDWYEESGYRLAKEILLLDDRPTAIFASSDMIAIGVMDAAKELGLKIPEDISIMGYDNRIIAKYARPRLTTISLPLYEVGMMAAKTLCEIIQNQAHQDKQVNMLVKGNVIERETTKAIQAD